jgi:hypothetical protein
MKPPQNSRADNMDGLGKSIGLPRGYQETPVTPDEPDALDGGDEVEGLGVAGQYANHRVEQSHEVTLDGTWYLPVIRGISGQVRF